LPELLHRDLSNATFAAGVDDVDTLEKLKQCIERRVCCLVVLLCLLLALGSVVCWHGCTVFDPSFSEKTCCRFSYFLVAITQTPAKQFLTMCQTQVAEIPKRRQQSRVERSASRAVQIPGSLQQIR